MTTPYDPVAQLVVLSQLAQDFADDLMRLAQEMRETELQADPDA